MTIKTHKRLAWAVLAGIIALCGVLHNVQAQTAISALPAGTTLGGTEPVPAVQTGATVRTTPAALATYARTTATGTVNTQQGTDIASASTINLDTATGNVVDVTGTTTITAVTLSQGRTRVVRFTGALTLTNGASLVLPGVANITTAAGDYAVFVGYASNVVRVSDYQRAALAPIVFGSYTPTLTNGTNAASSTAFPVRYYRIGNIVTISGRVDLSATAANVSTSLFLSLPINSTFTQTDQASGAAGVVVQSYPGSILGDTTTPNRVELRVGPTTTSVLAYFFTATYTVL